MRMRMWVLWPGNWNLVFSRWESGSELPIFPTLVFLIIDVFPPILEKNRATSPPESRTYPFNTGRFLYHSGWVKRFAIREQGTRVPDRWNHDGDNCVPLEHTFWKGKRRTINQMNEITASPRYLPSEAELGVEKKDKRSLLTRGVQSCRGICFGRATLTLDLFWGTTKLEFFRSLWTRQISHIFYKIVTYLMGYQQVVRE